ncbi:conjugal transfer protein TraL [Pseudodesulfovibrio tunisiensis]|uniref:nucleotide-binding protein n=1 Tax=Pseudodesulfovibrio tunisiensis TaxID=463192 RepID=UPI001FB2FB98|nr:conjugal transfer protein TraL [Pseudodesulfovibrio tunisiensis]
MATINMILQGKGGVGKSLAAGLLSQYFLEAGRKTVCIDTDPVNATLAGYRALDAIALDIMNGGDDVDPRQFDRLVDAIVTLPEDTQVVVDNGAATFLPFCSYLAENAVFDVLHDSGQTVRLHSVVTGGQAILDTLNGLDSLITNFEGKPLYVWLNPFFGPITSNGKPFEEFPVFRDHMSSFEAVIRLPNKRKETFGRDLENLLADRLSFTEALTGDRYSIMVRQRLRMMWREIRAELDKANL